MASAQMSNIMTVLEESVSGLHSTLIPVFHRVHRRHKTCVEGEVEVEVHPKSCQFVEDPLVWVLLQVPEHGTVCGGMHMADTATLAGQVWTVMGDIIADKLAVMVHQVRYY